MAAQKYRPWIVGPHQPIQKLEDNLWAVVGQMPNDPLLKRRMTVARLADGSLAFYNAVPLRDEALDELRAWGTPRWLIIPNRYHKLDAHPFRERLRLNLVCAKDVAKSVSSRVSVDGTVEDFPTDPSVQLIQLRGTSIGELAMAVRHGDHSSAIFADAFMNVPNGSGFMNALLRISGGPKCPIVFRFAFVRDRRALGQDLHAIAALPGLARLIPTHGDVVELSAAEVLRKVTQRDLRVEASSQDARALA